MDGGDENPGNGNVGSRWNPTKEQIAILEEVYGRGLKTPKAEQIEEIADRLRVYGQVEGKNVFYWFQNHKARQRQKLKQQQQNQVRLGCLTRVHQMAPSPPLFVVPLQQQNVVLCSSPYYMPSAMNQHYTKVPPPQAAAAEGGSLKKAKLMTEDTTEQRASASQRYNIPMQQGQTTAISETEKEKEKEKEEEHMHRVTLDLFPIHPTGVLEAKTDNENDGEILAQFCSWRNK